MLAKPLAKVRKVLPPARLFWIILLVIALWGQEYLGWVGIPSLFLPLLAALFDVGYQSLRFPSLRFPDGAMATGFLLALLFPPMASILLTGTVTVVAISLKHALRWKGTPLQNPAALGVVLGGLFLGLSPAWWVGLGTTGQLMIPILGGLLLWRDRSRWRALATFLGAYAGLASMYHFFFTQVTSPGVFVLTILDPAVVFFALFMVVDPRTSPSDPYAQPMYGAAVAIGSLVLSLILPSLGILVALLIGNGISVLIRPAPAKLPQKKITARKKSLPHLDVSEWTAGRRGGIAFAVLILLAVVSAGSVPASVAAPVLVVPGSSPPTQPTPVGTPSLTNCLKDNPSIPAATLTQLHKMLGPSVILSYDSSTGTTVFYDPVNQVTVTEVDLYEDYGYAEFNGDDYAVSGCVP